MYRKSRRHGFVKLILREKNPEVNPYIPFTFSSPSPNSIEIKFRTVEKDFDPFQINEKGNWIDLKAAEDVTLKAGDFALISLGVAMKLPAGFEAWLAPRSSTFMKWGIILTNSIGIVDNSYCGNDDIWKMPVYATRDTEIKKGDRIAQFRIIPSMIIPCLNRVDELSSENRGGFGSTGHR